MYKEPYIESKEVRYGSVCFAIRRVVSHLDVSM
jgi:hypothetical protein